MAKDKIIDPFFPLKVEEVKTVESGLIVPRRAIINADTGKVVSVVSNRYNIVQNKVLVEKFEDYLEETDVKFIRTGAGCNMTGSTFWANYRFPDIKTNVGEYTTKYHSANWDGGAYVGKTLNDDIELLTDVWNSYNGSSGFGMMIGGFRKVCLNGLMAKEKLFRISEGHVGEEDMINSFVINFETAKNIFINNLAKSWEQLTTLDFDKVQAATVLRSLELGKLYAKKMGYVYNQELNAGKLKTMWDFYNMITWFTTHVMEQRSRHRAVQTSMKAAHELMNELHYLPE